MRWLALLLCLLGLAALVAPASGSAHPLGNFTINQYSRVELSGNRIYVLYVLDMAEIPTFQARTEVSTRGRAHYGRSLAARIGRGLRLHVGGERIPLQEVDHELAFPRGQAGLATTRFAAVYASPSLRRGGVLALSYRDGNYAGRLGWKEIVIRAGSGAQLERTSVPSESASNELLAYPKNLLESPLHVTEARARFVPGPASGSPPALAGARVVGRQATVQSTGDDGFAALIGRGDLSLLVILGSLAAALFWGAAHALSPGHGKTIVTAYLVGQRGKPRHAVYLGLIVTVTHTIGVFTLGLVTLALSQFIVPDRLYPWLNLASGLLVIGIGAAVLYGRFRRQLAHARAHAAGRAHAHEHHDHPHHHGHEHGHSYVPEEPGLRGLIAVGISGGLLPCPSALVVLLAAISLHRIAFGLLLILAFSLGLAATITAIGLVAVLARRAFTRLSFKGRVVRLLPAASALVIVVAGVVMTLHALPKVS
jgi:ABC-type nickel/cobalt efflux system permease component RcnA